MKTLSSENLSPADAQSLADKARLMRQVTRLFLVALIAFLSLWTLWIAPPPTANPITIWLIQTVPLALFIPGIFTGNPRVHIWLCFMILVYFCGGVIYAMSPINGWLGLCQALLTAGLFAAAMMYVRWNGKAIKAGWRPG
ncbi:MAG: DUF2069 domain-containing protein [Motiliproteus sp.]|nr:DUF2069 domain-containing protein [Motiliproteus sp.]MCW9053573.1 DUF2069 domain-containing protein [Motiliproteus sp.]